MFSAMFVSFMDEFDKTEEIQQKYAVTRKIIDFHNDVKGCVPKFNIKQDLHPIQAHLKRIFLIIFLQL